MIEKRLVLINQLDAPNRRKEMKVKFTVVYDLDSKDIHRLVRDYDIDLKNEDIGEIEDEICDALHDAMKCDCLEEYATHNHLEDMVELTWLTKAFKKSQ